VPYAFGPTAYRLAHAGSGDDAATASVPPCAEERTAHISTFGPPALRRRFPGQPGIASTWREPIALPFL
jgi:hypothetical protein